MRWLLFVACALDYSACKNEDKEQRDATTQAPPPPIGPFAPGGNPLAFTAKPLEVLQQTFTPSVPEQFLQTKASNPQASTSRSFSFLDTNTSTNGKGVSFRLNVQHPVQQKNSTPKPDEALHIGRISVEDKERTSVSPEIESNAQNGHKHSSGISGEIAIVGNRPFVLSDAHRRLTHKHLEREETPATHTLNNVHFTPQPTKAQDGIYFVPPVTPPEHAVTGDDLLNTIRPSSNIITPTDLPKIPEPPPPTNSETVQQRSAFPDQTLQNTIPVNSQEATDANRGGRDTGLFQDVNTGEVAPQQNSRFIQGITGEQISDNGERVQDSDERMSRIEADFHAGRRSGFEHGVRDPTLVNERSTQSKVDFTKESFEETFRRQKEELERKFSAKEFDPSTLSVTEFPRVAEVFQPEREADASFETPAKRQNQITRKNQNFNDGLTDARTKTIDFTIERKHHSGGVTTQTFSQVVPLRPRSQVVSSKPPEPVREEVIAPEPLVEQPAPAPPTPNSPAVQRQTFNRAVLEDQRRYREQLRLFEEDQRKYREQQRKFEEDQRRFEENRKRFEDAEKRFNEERKKYEQEKQRFEAERTTRVQQLTPVQPIEEKTDFNLQPAPQPALQPAPPPPRRIQKLRNQQASAETERPRVDDFTLPEVQLTPQTPKKKLRIPIESRHFTIDHRTEAKTQNVQLVDVEVKIPANQDVPARIPAGEEAPARVPAGQDTPTRTTASQQELPGRLAAERELPAIPGKFEDVINDPFFPVPLPTQRPSSTSSGTRIRSGSKKGFNFSQGSIYSDGANRELTGQARTIERNSTRNRVVVQNEATGFGAAQLPSKDISQRQRDHVESQEGQGDLPGTPGVDYPIYSIVPDTSFNCKTQESAGMYADIEAGCQAFHNCDPLGHKMSFLCPNGTVFKQELFICDWWYNVQCNDSDKFFHLNTNKYTTPRPRTRRRRRGDAKRRASA